MSTSFTVQHSISSGNTAGSPISPSSARLDTMGEGSPLGRDPVAMARSTPISGGTERAPSSRISSTRSLCNPSSAISNRSEEHTSELQSLRHLVCRLLLEKKKKFHRSPSVGRDLHLTSRQFVCSHP